MSEGGNVGVGYGGGKVSGMVGVDGEWGKLEGDVVYGEGDEVWDKYF